MRVDAVREGSGLKSGIVQREWKLRIRRVGRPDRPWLIERVRRGRGSYIMWAHTFEDAVRLLPAAWRLSVRVMRQVREEERARW